MTTSLQKLNNNIKQKKYYDIHKNKEEFKIKNRLRVKEYSNKKKDDPIYKERRRNNLFKYNNKPERVLKLKNYYNHNVIYFKERAKNRSRNIRLEVIYYYSNGEMKCNDCGVDYIEFLEIDHINNNGREHKRNENITNMYQYLKRNNYPNGYQVLCSNCNIKKIKINAREKGKFGTKSQKYRYKYKENLKFEVFSHYSINTQIKCLCKNCNESDIDKLCLDHINNDGAQHRKELKKIGLVGSNIYLWAKQNNYPKIFRIFCHNCNQSLSNYGYCPHDK